MLMPAPVLDAIAAQAQSLPPIALSLPSSFFASSAGDGSSWFVQTCQQLAPPLSILTFVGPMPAIQKIRMARNVAGVSLLPYSCMTANCGLWTTYGFLQNQASIWAPNMVGMMLAMYYFVEFIKTAYMSTLSSEDSSMSSPSTPVLLQHILSLTAVAFGTAAAVSSHQIEASLFGQAADLLFILSLLASLQTVLRTKSADSIALPVTLLTMTACFCRSVSGMEMQDCNVILPNVIGFLLGAAQVSFKLWYGKEIAPAPTAAAEHPLLAFDPMKRLAYVDEQREQPRLVAP